MLIGIGMRAGTVLVATPVGHVIVVTVGEPDGKMFSPRLPPSANRTTTAEPAVAMLRVGGFLSGAKKPVEVDDVAAEAVELGDHGMEDAVQVACQLFGPAPWPVLPGERLGQLGEPGDVGEERGAPDAVGKLAARGERSAPVAGQVRLRPVVRGCRADLDRCRDVGHLSASRAGDARRESSATADSALDRQAAATGPAARPGSSDCDGGTIAHELMA
jgi:hypothetical protein